MTMCRSTDHRLIRIVKRWLRRRTGSITTEEAPTLRQSTATSRRHRIRHCDDEEYSTPGSASSVYDDMHNDYSSLHNADAVGEQDQFCSSSAATTQVSRQPQCFECDCSVPSVPPSFSTRRRRMMCDDDGREKVPQPASSVVVEGLDGRQEVSLSSHNFSSDPSIGRSTTSLMSSSSYSSSSSSMVTCCFCRRWRHHPRHHQTGGKRPTELDVDDEYGRLTADTLVRHSSSLTSEASCIVPCLLQVEVTAGRSKNRTSPRRVPNTPIVPPSSSSTRHSCHGNNNVGDDLVCGCTSATKCMKNSFDATMPSATEIYDYVHLPTMSPSHRRTTRSCNTRSGGGERVRQQLHANQDYPPSIAISADGEESPFGRPLVSVMRPDRRDCNGPPPNRVAPFS